MLMEPLVHVHSLHSRHTSSVPLARLPSTCAQCHMGPDQPQIEIYEESKHGVMFAAQEKLLNLCAEPDQLTTRDLFIPTCVTCHMSGLNGLGVTHPPSACPTTWQMRSAQSDLTMNRPRPR
jgi:hypothetical protein